MGIARKPRVSSPDELRLTVPAPLMELFVKTPRIIIKRFPPGLWPIDLGILRNPEVLRKLAENKEFKDQFEIVIMPKG